MAHHIEARFDQEDNTFVPPLRTLGFNQNLTMNDSLLVQSYIESYDISYPEALRRIEDEVNELRQHLQTEGYYELNDIGTLTLNSEGNMEFRPCEAGILTPGLYGLGTFEMEPLAKSVAETVEEQVEEPTLLLTTEDEQQPAAEEEPVDENENTAPKVESEEEGTIVIKLSWLRNAVAVAAAVLAFFMIATPVSNSKLDPQMGVQHSSIIPLSNQEPAVTWEEVEEQTPAADEQAAPQENAETIAEAPADHQAPEAAPAPPAEDYCIVLASQVSQKNADDFVALLEQKGFSKAYITNKKFRRVVYGHYATKDDALSELRQLRQQSAKLFSEGWVMKQ